MINDPRKPFINDIPNNWTYKKASELFSESKENNKPESKLYSVTRDRGIIPQSESDKRDISSSNREKYKVIKPNYIVYNTMRMWQGVSAVSQNIGIVSPAYTVLKPIKSINTQFIGYLFKYQPMINVFHRYSQGLVNDTLNLKYQNFKDILIPTPPINEQRKIAAILSSVDNAIEKTEQIIEQTETVKKGLIQELLTRGIGHTEFKDSPIGEIPSNWELLNLDEFATLRREKYNPKTEKEDEKYIGLEHIEQNTGRLLEYGKALETLSIKNKFYKNDILFGKLRPYLKKYWLCEFDGVCGTEILPIKCSNNILPHYLYYLIQQDTFIDSVSSKSFGTKMPRTSWQDMKEYKFIIPPLNEQKKIVNFISSYDKKLNNERIKISNLNFIKQGLMQKLLTGRVRVKVDDSEEVLS